MTPHQGSGAGQAVEDAYILALLLSHPKTTLKTLPDALKVYEEIRRPLATEVQKGSFAAGTVFDFLAPESLEVRDFGKNGNVGDEDFGKLWNLGHMLCDRWRWAWTTGSTGVEEQAISMLEARLANL